MIRECFLAVLVLFVSSSLLVADTVDVRMLRSVDLGATPRQITSTADGQRIYVLTEQGDVRIYSADGQYQGTFEAGPDVTGITPQGANRLILEMTELQQMLLVALEPVVQISTAGAPTLGPDDAPVSIVIFDDFECPYCAKVVPLLREVLAAYPDQVKLVYKNFPLGMHKNARIAAVAGLAAAQQGKFWQLHDLLFANYKKLSEQKITQLAEEAGLDMEKFARARNNPQLRQQINAELQEGRKIGVRGTPTIFVNGRRLPQRSKTAFDQLIQAELARQTVSATRGKTAQ